MFPLQDCVCLPPNKISVANERKETGDKKSKMKYFGTDPRAQICPISIPHDEQIFLFRVLLLFVSRSPPERNIKGSSSLESLHSNVNIEEEAFQGLENAPNLSCLLDMIVKEFRTKKKLFQIDPTQLAIFSSVIIKYHKQLTIAEIKLTPRLLNTDIWVKARNWTISRN